MAHKTGTSGFYKGVSFATNDVGVIELPDGRVIFVSVFITGSREETPKDERVIAEIARQLYEAAIR